MTRVWNAVAVASALCATSCEDRPGERAMLDREVGKATAGDVQIRVVDGLAAVHVASSGVLELWASAPAFEVVARSDAKEPQPLTVTIENAMVDGVLSAPAPALVDALPPAPGDPVTTRRFTVSLPPAETVLSFETSDLRDRLPFRFALLSDVQEGIDRVEEVYDVIERQPDLRFVLGAGDLADTGTREELELYQTELAKLDLPYYTTLGNHDVHSDMAWHPLFGRGNFRFVFRGVQFTMIDSAASTLDSLAYDWLDAWLAEGRERVHVVAMHIPPLDPVGTRNGAFGDRNEAGALLAKLARADVDLTLYGHIHSFYQFDNAGIPAFISGGGGAGDEKLDGYGRHFMVIEIGAEVGVVTSEVIFID